MRETLAQQIAMRRIVQPSRRAAWMRQWNQRHAVLHTPTAHGIIEWDLPPEPVDRETAEKKDHPGLKDRELLIEPRSAERDLGRGRPAIAASGRRLSRIALRDRGAIWEMVLVDSRVGEPTSELRAGATAERLTGRELDRARRLADDRNAIANGSRDDRAGPLDKACVDAFRARTDARVEILKDALSVAFWLRHW
jgi:hypothetical protein